jgi:CheY-like chemotaxis protein
MTMIDELPDLVVTDLAMQPFDGFHLLRVMAKSDRLRGIAVVVVTGLTEEEVRQRGTLDASVPLYRKPIAGERLAGLIDGLMLARR